MALYRVWKGKEYPAQLKLGEYVLGDNSLGSVQHEVTNEVRVRTEREAVDLINKGFYLRVEAERGSRGSLVRLNLFHDGVRLT